MQAYTCFNTDGCGIVRPLLMLHSTIYVNMRTNECRERGLNVLTLSKNYKLFSPNSLSNFLAKQVFSRNSNNKVGLIKLPKKHSPPLNISSILGTTRV